MRFLIANNSSQLLAQLRCDVSTHTAQSSAPATLGATGVLVLIYRVCVGLGIRSTTWGYSLHSHGLEIPSMFLLVLCKSFFFFSVELGK